MSNGATAVKGAWSEAEGVQRSGAETLDGIGSEVARLFVGGGKVMGEFCGFVGFCERSERGDACALS